MSDLDIMITSQIEIVDVDGDILTFCEQDDKTIFMETSHDDGCTILNKDQATQLRNALTTFIGEEG